MNLATGETQAWDDVAAFTVARGSGHLMLRRRRADEKAKCKGTDVILHDLARATDLLLGSVDATPFSHGGDVLANTVDAAHNDANGLFVMQLATGRMLPLDNDTLAYAGEKWSEDGASLAAVKGHEVKGKRETENTLLAFPSIGAASKADRYMFTRQTFVEFPDLRVAGPALSNAKKITDANPAAGGVRVGASHPHRLRQQQGCPPPGDPRAPRRLRGGREAADARQLLREEFAEPPPPRRADVPLQHGVDPTEAVSRGYITLIPAVRASRSSARARVCSRPSAWGPASPTSPPTSITTGAGPIR